jgi:hypothetical protein
MKAVKILSKKITFVTVKSRGVGMALAKFFAKKPEVESLIAYIGSDESSFASDNQVTGQNLKKGKQDV